jgi:hypothetical protein
VPAEPFAVVLEPAAEMRSQRAKRIMVSQIKAEHAERYQRASLELAAEAFRARTFIDMAAEALGHVPIPGPGTRRRHRGRQALRDGRGRSGGPPCARPGCCVRRCSRCVRCSLPCHRARIGPDDAAASTAHEVRAKE